MKDVWEEEYLLTTFEIIRVMILFGYMYHLTYSIKSQKRLWLCYYIVICLAYLIALLIFSGIFSSREVSYRTQVPVCYNMFLTEFIAIPLVLLYEFYSMNKLTLKEESIKKKSVKAIQERDDKFGDVL